MPTICNLIFLTHSPAKKSLELKGLNLEIQFKFIYNLIFVDPDQKH